jgi:hypothetical protein
MAAPFQQQPLQGGVSLKQEAPQASPYEALLNDQSFADLPEPDQIDYLEQEYLPKVDQSFNQLDPQDRWEYIQSEVIPYVTSGTTKRRSQSVKVQTSDLRPQGMEALDAQLKAQVNQFRNTHPLLVGASELVSPWAGMAEGALQGLSAGGYTPPHQAGETWIRGAQRGVGNLIGGLGGFLGASTLLTPLGAGALYGGASSLNQQADEGRNINNMDWTRVGAQTALGAGTGLLPATFGGRLGTRMLAGAGLGAATGAAPLAIDQMQTQGRIDFSDPAYMQAMLQGAGMGIGSAWLGGPSRIPAVRPKPISLSQVRQQAPPRTLQAHATAQAPPRIIPSQPQNVGQRIQQAGQRLGEFRKLQANKPQEHRNALRQAAIDLHEMLHSDDPTVRIQGQALKKQFEQQAADKYSRTTPGKIRKPGNPHAKQVLAELDIYKEQRQKRATFQGKDKTAQEGIINAGFRMRQTKEGAAKFENMISQKFNPDEKKIIMGRIRDIEDQQKVKATGEKAKKTARREKGIAKRNEINRKRQEERQAAIKRENDRIKAELEKQRVELSDTRKRAKIAQKPKVLQPDQIEQHSDKLLKAYQEGRKGTVDGELARLRGIVRANHAKDGLISAERSAAIQETHARVLDRYYQKKAEFDTEQKSSPKDKLQARIQAKQENLNELESIKAAGGNYSMKTGKGRQKPLHPERLNWDEAKEYVDRNSDAYRYGEAIADAMANDGEVTVRYDSERSGDTGQFEYKRVAPIDFAFNYVRDEKGNILNARLVFHGVNKNGHTGEYYIEPSGPNKKTGTISAILEDPIVHKESFGKARRNGDPNVYFGPRQFTISDIMSRPQRQNAGLTSSTRAMLQEARSILARYESGEAVQAHEVKYAAETIKQTQSEPVNRPQEPKTRQRQNYVGTGNNKTAKVQKTTTLADVIADSLSRDRGNQDTLQAYDTLESMGYDVRPITRDRNTLNTGKQYSVTISGKAYRFSDETLTGFLGHNKIKISTLARGINARGKGFNQERILSMLPDSEAKATFLEEMKMQEVAERDAGWNAMIEDVNNRANDALDKLNQARTMEEYAQALDEIDNNPDFNHLEPTFAEDLGVLIRDVSERLEKAATEGAPEGAASSAGRGAGTPEGNAGKVQTKAIDPEIIRQRRLLLSKPAAAIRKVSRHSEALQEVMAKDTLEVSDLRRMANDLEKLDPENKQTIEKGVDC